MVNDQMVNKFFLAPMEDVTDPSFRLLCKRFGADRVYTEFVNADALVRDIPSTMRKLDIRPEERPVAIQIYGREPGPMADAARIVEQAHPDFIDINFGCPVKKVAGKGAGAGLLRDIPKLLEITRAVVDAVHTPVTVKTRLGWDADHLIITDLAEALQDCGIAELTIHGRTRCQMYTGSADWTLIGAVKNNPRMHIPIIGNGDITTPEQAALCFDRYGVDAVMIGRATFGCPWLFEDMHAGHTLPRTLEWCLGVLRDYVDAAIAWVGDERRGIVHSRRHLAATPVLKGLPDFRQTRIRLLRTESRDELFAILDEILTRYSQS
ncbi:MAG: tRNA-dihydrouridine synthase family protein [Paludibacteraceae bacterium]|nr:tRNA-dihydrouridine synthase family protein [Paludibacteraceae bacterium]